MLVINQAVFGIKPNQLLKRFSYNFAIQIIKNGTSLTFEVDANLGAVVLQCGALVDVLAHLGILFRGDVAAIAGANVATATSSQVVASMLAAAVGRLATRAGRVTSAFVRLVAAVVAQVADHLAFDAVAVGAGELRVGIAGLGPFGAEGDVVLVGSVFAVVVAVADLPTEDAASVVALEPVASAALVGALFRPLVRVVSAVVLSVATIF